MADRVNRASGVLPRARNRNDGVVNLGEMRVDGKIHKPSVFYVLGRSEFKYKGLNLKRSFVVRIMDSVRKNPF